MCDMTCILPFVPYQPITRYHWGYFYKIDREYWPCGITMTWEFKGDGLHMSAGSYRLWQGEDWKNMSEGDNHNMGGTYDLVVHY